MTQKTFLHSGLRPGLSIVTAVARVRFEKKIHKQTEDIKNGIMICHHIVWMIFDSLMHTTIF